MSAKNLSTDNEVNTVYNPQSFNITYFDQI